MKIKKIEGENYSCFFIIFEKNYDRSLSAIWTKNLEQCNKIGQNFTGPGIYGL